MKNFSEVQVGNKIVDMKEIYKKVALFCREKSQNCPVIFTNQELPLGVNIIRLTSPHTVNDILLTSERLSTDETIKEITNEIICGKRAENTICIEDTYKYFTSVKDMTPLYLLMVFSAESLQIRCPVLETFRNSSQNTCTGYESILDKNDESHRTLSIQLYINLSDDDIDQVLRCAALDLIAGMREAWQHEKHYDEFYKDYDETLKGDMYHLQPAVLDIYVCVNYISYRVFHFNYLNMFSISNIVKNAVYSRMNRTSFSLMNDDLYMECFKLMP